MSIQHIVTKALYFLGCLGDVLQQLGLLSFPVNGYAWDVRTCLSYYTLIPRHSNSFKRHSNGPVQFSYPLRQRTLVKCHWNRMQCFKGGGGKDKYVGFLFEFSFDAQVNCIPWLLRYHYCYPHPIFLFLIFLLSLTVAASRNTCQLAWMEKMHTMKCTSWKVYTVVWAKIQEKSLLWVHCMNVLLNIRAEQYTRKKHTRWRNGYMAAIKCGLCMKYNFKGQSVY